MGRPRTVMTADAKAKIIKAVRLGLWPDRAAEMHGIRPSTMRAERRRDDEFATAIKEAEAQAEASVHGKILRHMDKQWTACAWMLERRWPQRWAKREIVDVGAGSDAKRLLEQIQAMRQVSQMPSEDAPA